MYHFTPVFCCQLLQPTILLWLNGLLLNDLLLHHFISKFCEVSGAYKLSGYWLIIMLIGERVLHG